MLDVHPPHAATHSWKDFSIHIATIVIGLLIAVGLEQTVEAVHHARQRKELIESLSSDTEVLEEDARAVVEVRKPQLEWLRDREARIGDAVRNGHPPEDLPEQPIRKSMEVLTYTHFEAAKASGVLQLLSTEDLDAFSDVNVDVDLASIDGGEAAEATQNRRAFEAGFRAVDPKYLDFSKASSVELREYIRLMERERIAITGQRLHADVAAGAARAVLAGERHIRKLQQAENDAVNQDFGASVPYVVPRATQGASH